MIPQHTSASAEWYTPVGVLGRARAALACSEFDLDPASSVDANRRVRARHIYTVDDNGLLLPWGPASRYDDPHRVWCNPPYGRIGPEFVARAIDACDQRQAETVLLVKAAVETRWFAGLWRYPVCFPSRRIQFDRGDGGATTSAPHASAIVCLSWRAVTLARFAEAFHTLGPVAIVPNQATYRVWTHTATTLDAPDQQWLPTVPHR